MLKYRRLSQNQKRTPLTRILNLLAMPGHPDQAGRGGGGASLVFSMYLIKESEQCSVKYKDEGLHMTHTFSLCKSIVIAQEGVALREIILHVLTSTGCCNRIKSVRKHCTLKLQELLQRGTTRQSKTSHITLRTSYNIHAWPNEGLTINTFYIAGDSGVFAEARVSILLRRRYYDRVHL